MRPLTAALGNAGVLLIFRARLFIFTRRGGDGVTWTLLYMGQAPQTSGGRNPKKMPSCRQDDVNLPCLSSD